MKLALCFQEFNQKSIFSQFYGKNLPPSSKPDTPMVQQEPSLYSLFEGTPWSPSLPASSGRCQLLLMELWSVFPEHMLPSDWQITPPPPVSPPTPPTPAACPRPPPLTATEACPSPTLGPLVPQTAGTAGEQTAGRPTRVVSLALTPPELMLGGGSWIMRSFYPPGTVSGFGLDYLPTAPPSTAPDTTWHQGGSTGSWTNQETPMEESSSTVLLDSLKVGGGTELHMGRGRSHK